MIGNRIIGGNDPEKRNKQDFYPTPPDVTEALMRELNLPKSYTIWESACGNGAITKKLESMGYTVVGTDITTGNDYLTEPYHECDWIITNPPFMLSEEFIRRSKEHGKPFALLLKSQYWHAKRRYKLFEECKPTAVYPLTWRPDFGGTGGSPLMDVIWTVWGGCRRVHIQAVTKAIGGRMRRLNEAERNQIEYLRRYKASLIDRLIGACEAVNEEIKAVKSGEWYRQMKGEQE